MSQAGPDQPGSHAHTSPACTSESDAALQRGMCACNVQRKIQLATLTGFRTCNKAVPIRPDQNVCVGGGGVEAGSLCGVVAGVLLVDTNKSSLIYIKAKSTSAAAVSHGNLASTPQQCRQAGRWVYLTNAVPGAVVRTAQPVAGLSSPAGIADARTVQATVSAT